MKDRRFLSYATLFIITAAVLAAASFIGKAQNGNNTAPQPGTALTENDFVNDPSLSAVPEAGVVATFLENPNSISGPDDTGTVGMDIIPFKYASGMNQTFCWQDDNTESRHIMTLVDSNATEVLGVEANGDCVTKFISQGNYEMRIQHDASGDEVFATIFSIPEGDAENSFKTVLSTNNCQGCDLSGANFSNAVLADTDLQGADLTGADLSEADLSGTNLSNSHLAGANLSGANLTAADLSGADLTDALTANANFTEANLTNVISFDENEIAKESILAQEEPEAPGPEPCPSNNLRPTGGDIVIDHACNVPAGTYQYGNINIINGGSLNFNDANINFWAKSILIQNGGSMIAGENTNLGAFGAKGGTLTIHLYGKEQGTGGKGITCKTAGGQTDVMCGVDQTTWMSNEPPNPNSCKPSTNLPENDCFYQYKTLPVDTGDPNGYFGYKVIAVSYGGTLQLFGKKGATYPDTNPDPSNSGKSWVRLAADLKGGEPNLTVDDHLNPVDWKKDDHIVVTTTDYLPGHSEELTIKADPTMKDSNGNTIIEVNEQIRYPHSGTAYPFPAGLNTATKIEATRAETRAAVALLTRSIRIVSGCNSDNIADCQLDCGSKDKPCFPVSQGFIGGHTIVRQGFKTFQVQGVEFYQLGQGGRLGHYPVHFHLARKTPKDTFVKDCSIHDSMTRWITVHATHGVLLARNVGHMSVGHGFYLEDGTEINNRLYSNIGILARAAIENEQNPRKVPGILSVGPTDKAIPPNNSDFANPAVFWIMNGWNDFEHNMAVGAGTCGVCYWLLPGRISGPSQMMKWDSYASSQKNVFGGAPLRTFRGNFCSSAQLSFNTVAATDACNGLAELKPVPNTTPPDMLPIIAGQRIPFLCGGTCSNNKGQPCQKDSDCGMGNTCTQDCSEHPQCAPPNPDQPAFDNRDFCAVEVLDRYTSSFHWPEKNFAAIWLRGRYFLLSNSVLSDTQNGGLGFVTGGDYTLSSVLPGNWQVARKTAFIGATQKDNPLASEAGPFNPLKTDKVAGLKCENTAGRENHCLSMKEGITMPISNFAMQQRFYNIYDGPNYQDSNAYLDIVTTSLDPQCKPGNCPKDSGWMYTSALGIPIDNDQNSKDAGKCVLPNAAIGWKQPNGFFYPPAFHSSNLFFNNVDIRHLVIEPLWKPGTFESDLDQIKKNYCTFDPTTTKNTTFSPDFSAVDRQTVLNDDDATLTGLKSPPIPAEGETISVNLDTFFDAPVEAPECRSFDIATLSGTPSTTGGTAKTSPYEYLSTVVFPDCVVTGDCGGKCSVETSKGCARNANCQANLCVGTQCSVSKTTCKSNDDCKANVCENSTWGESCSTQQCYGVPLTRQLVTTTSEPADVRTIPMMGMGFSQRSMLTVNNGIYYVDTTVSEKTQRDGADRPAPTTSINLFRPGNKYYVFFVYANERTKQKYQIYIGENLTDCDTTMCTRVAPVRVDIRNQDLVFKPATWTGLKVEGYNKETGILTVSTDFTEFKSDFDDTKKDYCKPKSFCQLDGTSCKSSLSSGDPLHEFSQFICENFAGKDIDCPLFNFGGPNSRRLPGCLGFAVTLGDSSQFMADGKDRRPPTTEMDCFPPDTRWKVPLTVDKAKAGAACSDQKLPDWRFCGATTTPIEGTNTIVGTEEDDVLTGTQESDIIFGLGGNDIIDGRGGSDWISGGPGNDEITGGRGDDIIFGEEGDDFLKGGGGKDELDGGSEADIVKGGKGKDICVEGEDVRGCEQ